MSTEKIDSHGTILKQDWDLSRIKSNPVFLWAHNSDEMPLGRITEIGVEDGELRGTVEFAPEDINPNAPKVYKAYKTGFLRGCSVGFRSHDIRIEEHDDVKVPILSKNELYELSAAPVPSNSETVSKMLDRMLAESTAADERGINMEKQMELEEVQTALAESEEKRAVVVKERDVLIERIAALEESRGQLEERAKKAEAKLVEGEISALIGKKMTPKEAEVLTEMRSVSHELYQKQLDIVKARDDMNIVADNSVMGNDPTPSSGEDLNDRIAAR
jgi:HK97 family phage prohead protease